VTDLKLSYIHHIKNTGNHNFLTGIAVSLKEVHSTKGSLYWKKFAFRLPKMFLLKAKFEDQNMILLLQGETHTVHIVQANI